MPKTGEILPGSKDERPFDSVQDRRTVAVPSKAARALHSRADQSRAGTIAPRSGGALAASSPSERSACPESYRRAEASGLKWCQTCGLPKPLSEFGRKRKDRTVPTDNCNACRKARADAQRAKGFGPLPGQDGSPEMMAELARRRRLLTAKSTATAPSVLLGGRPATERRRKSA